MNKLTDDEKVLFAYLLSYPEIIDSFSDIPESSFSSPEAKIIYKTFIRQSAYMIKNTSYKILLKLKRLKVFASLDTEFLLDSFGIPSQYINEIYAEDAYKNLINISVKEYFVNNLNKINLDEELDFEERLEKLDNLVATTNGKIKFNKEIVCLNDVHIPMEYARYAIFGIPSLDRICLIDKNWFVIIASRPFNGKTSFATKVAMENTRHGRVLFYSMEMSKERIAEKANSYGDYYKKENFFILDGCSISLAEIRSHVKTIKPRVIIIDQLNKVNSPAGKDYDRFTWIATNLKMMATSLGIPIIALAQINRSAENKRPELFHLKNSGSLEEEADAVIILHVQDRNEHITLACLDKNRSPKGTLKEIPLKYNPDTNFYNDNFIA